MTIEIAIVMLAAVSVLLSIEMKRMAAWDRFIRRFVAERIALRDAVIKELNEMIALAESGNMTEEEIVRATVRLGELTAMRTLVSSNFDVDGTLRKFNHSPFIGWNFKKMITWKEY